MNMTRSLKARFQVGDPSGLLTSSFVPRADDRLVDQERIWKPVHFDYDHFSVFEKWPWFLWRRVQLQQQQELRILVVGLWRLKFKGIFQYWIRYLVNNPPFLGIVLILLRGTDATLNLPTARERRPIIIEKRMSEKVIEVGAPGP